MLRVWWALWWPAQVPLGKGFVSPAAGGPVTVCPIRAGLSHRETRLPRSHPFPGWPRFNDRWIQEVQCAMARESRCSSRTPVVGHPWWPPLCLVLCPCPQRPLPKKHLTPQLCLRACFWGTQPATETKERALVLKSARSVSSNKSHTVLSVSRALWHVT